MLRLSNIVTILFLAACVESIPDKTKWGTLVCGLNGLLTPNDARMVEIKACGDGPCIYACQAGQLGLLNEDGTTSLEIYQDWADAIFPAEHKDLAKKHFADCYEKFGRHIDLADKQCVMSKDYNNCVWGLTPSLKCKYES